MPNPTITYEEALQELQELVDAMENNATAIEHIAEQTKRAAWLIQYCRERLHSAEAQLNAVFDQGEPQQNA